MPILTADFAAQCKDRDIGRAIDAHGHVDRPNAAADEDAPCFPAWRSRPGPGTCVLPRAPTPGNTTWPPCVWPDNTSCTSSAAASVSRRGSCASRIVVPPVPLSTFAISDGAARPEADAREIQPLALDRQRRALILQHGEAPRGQRRRHFLLIVVIAEYRERTLRRASRAAPAARRPARCSCDRKRRCSRRRAR